MKSNKANIRKITMLKCLLLVKSEHVHTITNFNLTSFYYKLLFLKRQLKVIYYYHVKNLKICFIMTENFIPKQHLLSKLNSQHILMLDTKIDYKKMLRSNLVVYFCDFEAKNRFKESIKNFECNIPVLVFHKQDISYRKLLSFIIKILKF